MSADKTQSAGAVIRGRPSAEEQATLRLEPGGGYFRSVASHAARYLFHPAFLCGRLQSLHIYSRPIPAEHYELYR
jgi:hypothetical protein